MDNTGTLVSHVDTELVTLDQIAKIPAPMGTSTFKPIPHIELIESLTAELTRRSISINRQQYAMRADGSRLFGVMDLSLNGLEGSCASLGLRTANDKTMALSIVAGLRVFVCDNLALNGDFIAMARRHTSGLNLRSELVLAVDKYEQHYATLKAEVATLKGRELSDTEAKAMIFDMFQTRKLPIRLLPEVGREYFTPRHEEFKPRTAWSLHNAFTEIAKVMPMTTRMEAVSAVGRYFGLTAKNTQN